MKIFIFFKILSFITLNFVYANELTEVLKSANNYTVKIDVSTEYPFIEDGYGGSGTGILINKEKGLIATNKHVATSSKSIIKVNFKSSDLVDAKQVYIDPHLDFAILEIDPEQIPDFAEKANLGCDFDIEIGSDVVAFGHPYSQDFTATRGIVSGQRYETGVNFESIQTDAPINPGNSGGALIDLDTNVVIGINTYGLDTEGLNFATPAKLFCTIIDLFERDTDPSPAILDLHFASNDRIDVHLKVSKNKGNYDFQISDIIKKVDNVDVSNPSQLIDQLRGKNQSILTVQRKDEEIEIEVNNLNKISPITERKGLLVSEILISNKYTSSNSDLSEEFWNQDNNLVIQSIGFGTSANIFKFYDRILLVDNQSINDLDELFDYLQDKEEVDILVERSRRYDGKTMIINYFDSLKVEDVQMISPSDD